MGGTVEASVHLYATPADHVDQVVELLQEFQLLPESKLDDDAEGMRTEVVLTVGLHRRTFTDGMAGLDFVDELTPKLAALGCTFVAHQDQTDEYSGEIAWHVPDLGAPEYGLTDGQGDVIVPAASIEKLLTDAGSDIQDHLTWTVRLDRLAHVTLRALFSRLDAEADAEKAAAR